jgi:hypothetical protein
MKVDELIAALKNYEKTWPTGERVEVTVMLEERESWQEHNDEFSITGLEWIELELLEWQEAHLTLKVSRFFNW